MPAIGFALLCAEVDSAWCAVLPVGRWAFRSGGGLTRSGFFYVGRARWESECSRLHGTGIEYRRTDPRSEAPGKSDQTNGDEHSQNRQKWTNQRGQLALRERIDADYSSNRDEGKHSDDSQRERENPCHRLSVPRVFRTPE